MAGLEIIDPNRGRAEDLRNHLRRAGLLGLDLVLHAGSDFKAHPRYHEGRVVPLMEVPRAGGLPFDPVVISAKLRGLSLLNMALLQDHDALRCYWPPWLDVQGQGQNALVRSGAAQADLILEEPSMPVAGAAHARRIALLRNGCGGLAQAFGYSDFALLGEEHALPEMALMPLRNHLLAERQMKIEATSLKIEATLDPLTRIYNRRYGLRHAEAVLKRAFYGRCHVLMIDICQFKQVNDRYGHVVGDRVLNRLAQALRRCLRRCDLIFRYGGDEFCIWLEACTKEDALRIISRLYAAAASVYPSLLAVVREIPSAAPLEIAIGHATYSHQERQNTVEALISCADADLYHGRAKNTKRLVR